MTILRKSLAVVGGVFAAGAVIGVSETMSHSMFKGGAMFAAVVAGYGLGGLVGTAVVTYFADRRTALAIPVILFLLALANSFGFPHPLWFMPAVPFALMLGWYTGSRLEPRADAAGTGSR